MNSKNLSIKRTNIKVEISPIMPLKLIFKPINTNTFADDKHEVEVVEQQHRQESAVESIASSSSGDTTSDEINHVDLTHDYHQPNIVNQSKPYRLLTTSNTGLSKPGRKPQSDIKQCPFCLIEFRQPSEFIKHKMNVRRYCRINDNLVPN